MALKKVKVAELKRFMIDCLKKVGAPEGNATELANTLVAADARGHYSHGLNRLEIQSGVCDPSAAPAVVKYLPSTALVDGRNGLGPVVGNFCMGLAIKKAEKTGVGWVVAKGSNHYGMAAWYSMQAIEKGMVGLSFTNTSPLMSPTRTLGTNPISFAAPGINDSFVLDMATTTASLGKIEVKRREKKPIPNVWAQGPDGKPTADPEIAYNTSCLLPIGGTEETSGYKGYGLALMVEAMCGIPTGSSYGHHIRKWGNDSTVANLGQCFIALNLNGFESGFQDRMSDLMNYLRNMPKADPTKNVMVPGDPERENEAMVKKEDGIYFHINQLTSSESLAQKLGVQPMALS